MKNEKCETWCHSARVTAGIYWIFSGLATTGCGNHDLPQVQRSNTTGAALTSSSQPVNGLVKTAAEVTRSSSGTLSTEPGTSEVKLVTGNWEDVQGLVAIARGNVVVLEIWTTTCLTCVQQFPKLVELHAKSADQGLTCISVNCDYDGIRDKPPEFYRAPVQQFLERQRATFSNVLIDVPLLELLQKLELHSTPAVYVYDRKGLLAKRFDNDSARADSEEFTSADVERLVDQLLRDSR